MKSLNRHLLAFTLGVSVVLTSDLQATSSSLAGSFQDDLAPVDKRPRLWMYKQDPSVSGFGKPEQVVSLVKVDSGPKNRLMEIKQNVVPKNKSGDFNSTTYTSEEVDSISSFATISRVYTMYRMDLERLKAREPKNIVLEATVKMWDSGVTKPLMIYPHAGTDMNAFYHRDVQGNRSLKFFSFQESGTTNIVHTCQSADIVAHETGHALLDLLKPAYFSTNSAQTGALHEAFGDLTAVLGLLDQPDMSERAFVESRGNLHTSTFLNKLAEEFGTALGSSDGLRNADKDFMLSKVGDEVHDMSQVFTGAVYDVLAEGALNHNMANGRMLPGPIMLYEAGRHVREVLLQSIVESRLTAPTFADIGQGMYNILKKREQEHRESIDGLNWSVYLVNQFQRHDIDVMSVSSSSSDPTKPMKAERRRICGTMVNKMHPINDLGRSLEDALTSSEGDESRD